MSEENLGQELYTLLAKLLNRKMNRTFQNCVRGESGVLSYLISEKDNVSAGELSEQLHVVPGRMTDILNSLESKKLIKRSRDEKDKRRVNVCITEQGRIEAEEKRNYITDEYQGLLDILGSEDIKELIRLLKIVLSYSPNLKE